MSVRLPGELTRGPLTLRLWREADAAAMHQVISDNIEWLRPWMPWVPQEPLPMERRLALIRGWHEQFDAGLDATYGIFLDGTPVGGAGLHQRIGPGGLEIGYWVSHTMARRRVAATTAALLTVAALDARAVDRVEIHHAAENFRSRGVPAALGYTLIGSVRQTPLAAGLSGELVVWRLTQLDPAARARLGGIRVAGPAD